MSSIVYLKNKKTNTIYVYLNESTWDPDKKKCVCKRKCIGHIDPFTGEIVPNRQHRPKDYAIVKSTGVCQIFDKISEKLGLTRVLALSFPGNWKTILSIAYYIAATEKELLFCKQWSDANVTPYGGTININTISALLGSISPNSISLFFSLWKDENECTEAYINTLMFLDSYKDLTNYSKAIGVQIDKENYGTRMEMYFSAKNNVPICYTISNMNTGRKGDKNNIKPAEFKKITRIVDDHDLDIRSILDSKKHITARISIENELASKAIDNVKDKIMNSDNYHMIFGTPLFLMSFMNYLNGKKYYTHISFDPEKAVSDLSSFISLVNGCRNELETGNRKPEHAYIYDKYLLCSKSGNGDLIVEHNSENILHHDENTGFSVVVSNITRNPEIALSPFFEQSMIEGMFDNIVNNYDNTNLNLFSETYYQNRIFIQFIAVIIRTEIERIMSASNMNKTLGYREMINEINNLHTVMIPDFKKPYYTSLSPVQMQILKVFDLDITDLYDR